MPPAPTRCRTAWSTNPHVFVSIATDGIVTIVAHRAEMGNGAARTSLPMIVADELDADWARVRVVQSPGDEENYGNQDTDGSRSVRHFIQPMRQVRRRRAQMLEQRRRQALGRRRQRGQGRQHEVVHKTSDKKLGYGELAADAAALPVPALDTLKLKDAERVPLHRQGHDRDRRPLRHHHRQGDLRPGRAAARHDLCRRSRARRWSAARSRRLDASAAMKVPGVEKIVKIDGTPAPAKFAPLGGVAVIAKNTWAAMKGREALKITWDDGPNESYDSDAYKAMLEENVAQARQGRAQRGRCRRGVEVGGQGDHGGILRAASRACDHGAAGRHGAHDRRQVGGLGPGAEPRRRARRYRQARSASSPKNVVLHNTLLGGGFGRKSKCDFAIEAALLSKAMDGAPVKVVWTREDDIQHGFYHTVTAERLEAGLDKDNKVVAWRHRSAAPSLFANFMPDDKYPGVIELGMGLVDTPFNVPNIRMESGEAQSHVRVGWFRSVNNVAHAWAIQSFVAEIAAELKRDPKDFLLELIGPARIVESAKKATHRVVELRRAHRRLSDRHRAAAQGRRACRREGGLGQEDGAKGTGLGIAAHRSFVSYIATVVEVEVDDKGNITIPRVDTAIDCGFCVNPERVRSQIEGAAVMGLSLAKYGEITLKNGRVEQSNFNDFQVVAASTKSPAETSVHIVEHGIDVPSSGVGEPGVPPFAPALCNAIFAATGKRIRKLPIGDQLA